MPYDDKTIEDPERDRRKDKKVDRCDAVGMVAQKRAPALRWLVCAENFIRIDLMTESLNVDAMVALIFFFLNLVASLFKSKSRLEAENAALRHQLTVLQRKIRGRVQFTNSDRLFFIQLYRWCPSVLKAMMIIRPETLVHWHRAGFRRYWRWKSGSSGGRPQSMRNCGR